MAEVPFYIAAQLRNIASDARTLAESKRLSSVFEMELFSLEKTVKEALATGEGEPCRTALAQGRRLVQALKDAPDKSIRARPR